MGAYLSRLFFPPHVPLVVDADSDVEIQCDCCSTTVIHSGDEETHPRKK